MKHHLTDDQYAALGCLLGLLASLITILALAWALIHFLITH